MIENQSFESNAIAEFTERFINQTNRSIFLTGKAGTGKTTLLKKIVSSTYKQTVIVAPTGIAALNAGELPSILFFNYHSEDLFLILKCQHNSRSM